MNTVTIFYRPAAQGLISIRICYRDVYFVTPSPDAAAANGGLRRRL
jgi:hypothetical protein